MEKDTKDVGFQSDAMFYLQNAIASEHHALMSYATSKNERWIQLSKMIRENRSKYLYMLVKEGNGQAYCFSKHIMACAMATKELGNRFLEMGKKELAEECFKESSDYEAMFVWVNSWEVNDVSTKSSA